MSTESEAEETRRTKFFKDLADGWNSLTPEQQAEYHAEMALWDCTLMDGLEDEPPYQG